MYLKWVYQNCYLSAVTVQPHWNFFWTVTPLLSHMDIPTHATALCRLERSLFHEFQVCPLRQHKLIPTILQGTRKPRGNVSAVLSPGLHTLRAVTVTGLLLQCCLHPLAARRLKARKDWPVISFNFKRHRRFDSANVHYDHHCQQIHSVSPVYIHAVTDSLLHFVSLLHPTGRRTK